MASEDWATNGCTFFLPAPPEDSCACSHPNWRRENLGSRRDVRAVRPPPRTRRRCRRDGRTPWPGRAPRRLQPRRRRVVAENAPNVCMYLKKCCSSFPLPPRGLKSSVPTHTEQERVREEKKKRRRLERRLKRRLQHQQQRPQQRPQQQRRHQQEAGRLRFFSSISIRSHWPRRRRQHFPHWPKRRHLYDCGHVIIRPVRGGGEEEEEEDQGLALFAAG